MLDLLNYSKGKPRVKLLYPWLDSSRNKLHTNFYRTREYVRHSSDFASSDHLLAKILISITCNKILSPQDYYDEVDDARLYYYAVNGINTDIQKAKAVLNGHFFGGKKAIEIYVADDSKFDIESNWRDWEPVRVIHSELSDYSCTVPKRGSMPKYADGITIISINILMLAMQYYYYTKSNTDMLIDDIKRRMGNYILRYPLCNMIPSIIDISFGNEIKQRLLGTPIYTLSKNNPIALIDTSYGFERGIGHVISYVRAKNNFTMIDALLNVPGIFRPNIISVSHYTHKLTNVSNAWILTYIDYSLWLLATELSVNKNVNSSIIKGLIYQSRVIKSSRYVESGSKTLAPVILNTVEKVLYNIRGN